MHKKQYNKTKKMIHVLFGTSKNVSRTGMVMKKCQNYSFKVY